jgi:hypothetical protein
MDKHIYLPAPDKKKLANDFKTSRVTVWSALNFKTQSGFAKALRAAALERGGVNYPKEEKL